MDWMYPRTFGMQHFFPGIICNHRNVRKVRNVICCIFNRYRFGFPFSDGNSEIDEKMVQEISV